MSQFSLMKFSNLTDETTFSNAIFIKQFTNNTAIHSSLVSGERAHTVIARNRLVSYRK